MKSPFLEVGPVNEVERDHPLADALRDLRDRHDLCGCILITFDGATGRVGVNATGFDDRFGRTMDLLGAVIRDAIVSKRNPATSSD